MRITLPENEGKGLAVPLWTLAAVPPGDAAPATPGTAGGQQGFKNAPRRSFPERGPGKPSSVPRGYAYDMTKVSLSLMMTVMAVLLLLSLGIAGCTTPAPSAQVPAASPVPVQKLSTAAPAEMALQPSDVPADLILLEKGERNVSDMRDWSLEHGWKGGYYASYQKQNGSSSSGVIFDQSLSIYPLQNISLIVPDTMQMGKTWAARDSANRSAETDTTLPAIGDSSSALKITDKSDNSHEYLIAFVKQDVYMEFYTNGTATDYETLKHLAGIAAAKIR